MEDQTHAEKLNSDKVAYVSATFVGVFTNFPFIANIQSAQLSNQKTKQNTRIIFDKSGVWKIQRLEDSKRTTSFCAYQLILGTNLIAHLRES